MTNRPPDHVSDAIEEAFRLRGWISNGYAQIEHLLGDIILKAFKMPEYEQLKTRLPNQLVDRKKIISSILEVDGFFSDYKEEIQFIMGGLEFSHDDRNILAHGFCTVLHNADEQVWFQFRKWHRDDGKDTELIKNYQMVNLEYQKTQIVHVSQRALNLSLEIHTKLGLVDSA